MSALSEALQIAFRDSGIKKTDISHRTRLAINYITQIFKGLIEPDQWDIKQICKAMEIDPEPFLELMVPGKKQQLEPVRKDVRFPKLKSTSSGTKLQKAEGRPCVICGKPAETAHYTGMLQGVFGKGTGQKVDNLFVADLCRECHVKFDQPAERKSLEASHEFMKCILLTQLRKVEEGRIVLK